MKGNKYKGSPCLIDDRPYAASIREILRDAICRLPDGLGTFSDIRYLMKMSQWLNHTFIEQ